MAAIQASEEFMSDKFTELAPNVFSLESDLRLTAGFNLWSRMVIIRSGESLLWVHSPLPSGDEWYDEAETLGTVDWLVAPNGYHHLYLQDAAKRFPNAKVAGPKIIRKKQKEVELSHVLGEQDVPETWPSGIQPIAVDGAPGASEFLFYDKPSQSLLVTDLVFNHRRPTTWMARTFVRLTSGWNGPARSSLWKFMVKDKQAFANSLEVLSALKIDRVIPAHLEPIDDVDLALSLMRTGKAQS